LRIRGFWHFGKVRADHMLRNCFRAVAAFALLLWALAAEAAPPVYTAIVDAGSGGTRLFLYKVTPGPYPVSELILQSAAADVPGTPYEEDDGIDNYACFPGGDPSVQAFYAAENVNPFVMVPLWEAMKGKLATLSPPVTAADVAVKVFATAGMRTAAEICGQPAVDNVYTVIRGGMTVSGLTNPGNEVRTIDGGTEEGLWSFINANDEYVNAFGRPAAVKLPKPPVGIIEVGGSSVQIVYPIAQAGSDPFAVQFQINNRVMTVHAQSWLHLGQDDMRKVLRTNRGTDGNLMAHRCWVRGFDKANDAGDVGFPALSANGAFNALNAACGSFMVSHIRTYMATPPDLSAVTAKFVGLGGLKYTLDAFGRLAGPLTGVGGFRAAVNTQCRKGAGTWPEINTSANAQRACPHGVYMSTLFSHPQYGIFRLNPQQFDRALVAKDVDGKSLSWIAGYLLLTYSR
jgi:hypothetical protein